MKPIVLVVAVLSACAFMSCGGGGGSGGAGGGPASVDVTGTWTGTWNSSNGINSGSIDATLTQTGSSISGSVSFTGSPCFAGGPISGNVGGANIAAALNAGGIHVTFSAAVSGVGDDMMNGTYSVVSAGACTGDTGTITLTRTSPLTLDPGPNGGTTSVTFVYDENGNHIGVVTTTTADEDR
jgi:hypothetical protein